MDDFTLNLLSNDEVNAINQDAAGKQAIRVIKRENYQVWVKDLEDGSKAIGIFNVGAKYENLRVDWPELGLEGNYSIRDLLATERPGQWQQLFQPHSPAWSESDQNQPLSLPRLIFTFAAFICRVNLLKSSSLPRLPGRVRPPWFVILLKVMPEQLSFSISAATRKPRNNEKDGVDYYFLSVEDFEAKIAADEFVEWEMVYEGKYYGTLKEEVANGSGTKAKPLCWMWMYKADCMCRINSGDKPFPYLLNLHPFGNWSAGSVHAEQKLKNPSRPA
jgi:hypothetical protein